MMKTLFLQPPSFSGFDGGAGSRYQAKREIKSFWYPTWLAQPAALVPGSKLIDARPPANLEHARNPSSPDRHATSELCVIHTSSPSFPNDVKVAEALEGQPTRSHHDRLRRRQGRRAVRRRASKTAPVIDFVARNEFDFTMPRGRRGPPLRRHRPASATRDATGAIVHNKDRATASLDMDVLPFVIRRLQARPAHGRLFHRLSEASLRLASTPAAAARSHCTFCLWPQTVGGHKYRVRSHRKRRRRNQPTSMKMFPQVQGISSSTTTPSPTTCRAPKPSRATARPDERHLVLQRQGQRSPRHPQGAEGITACACSWSATRAATSRSCTTSRRDC